MSGTLGTSTGPESTSPPDEPAPRPVVRPPFRVPAELRLKSVFHHFGMGGVDGAFRLTSTEVVRAARTPEGPGTLHLRLADGLAATSAWGPGANWLLDRAPDFIGSTDAGQLDPAHPALRRLAREHRGLKLIKTHQLLEPLIHAVVRQLITAREVRGIWRGIQRLTSEQAPGPFDLILPPEPRAVRDVPAFKFEALGLSKKVTRTLRMVCDRSEAIERLLRLEPEQAVAKLMTLPGIGPWTSNTAVAWATGWADAVPVGDYHLPNLVAWVLAREPRADDARMLELLEPYVGDRWRVFRLLMASGLHAPRYGPRFSPERRR